VAVQEIDRRPASDRARAAPGLSDDLAAVRLVLDGDHLQADDPRFRDFLFDLISRVPGYAVHLDMGEVTSLDSATLGTLITAYKGALAAGGCVRITSASPQVRAVLELTGTDRVLLAEGLAGGPSIGDDNAVRRSLRPRIGR
jgi:anti-anti-sigma factor